MVKTLSMQVAALTNQIAGGAGGKQADLYGIIEEEEVIEPEYDVNTQIPMFELVD